MNDHPIYNTIITVYIFNNKLYLNQNITKFTVHVSHFVKQINTIFIKIKHASQMGSVLYCDQTYKPSSVVNSHLSWPGVATAAHATFSKRAGQALYVSLRCCSE